jgi:osmotically-inducible protein OsmY
MTNSKFRFGFPLAIALAMVSAAAVANGTCDNGKCSGDSKIRSTIQTSLDQHPELGPPHSINVQTRAGVVYLYGQVGEGLQRDTAESIAERTPGVTRVVDSIYVSR